MPTIISRHKVGDINAWLAGHKDRLELFAPVSSGFRTFQDMDDPNSVVIIVETDDPAKLAAVINDPANDAVKARHTVLEPIIISTALFL
ncbi:MAG: hypothetical protein ABI358_01760 [Ginsengibacter sp.]